MRDWLSGPPLSKELHDCSFKPLREKVIILNAPPSAGKDTIANALCKATGATHSRFKEHLYLRTATLLNVPYDGFRELVGGIKTKETPHKSLVVSPSDFTKICKITHNNRAFTMDSNWNIHISPREALIFTSEVVIKPTMGNTYFGDIAAQNLTPSNGNVFSDGGFDEELLPIVEKVGKDSVYVVQFTRQGSESFEGDSRGWLDTSMLPEGNVLVTTNDGRVEDIVDYIYIRLGGLVRKARTL